MISLEVLENDIPEFIVNTEKILTECLSKWVPQDLYITKVDNWFDDKWLNYGGNLGWFVPVWNEAEVKVPPFHPNRIINSNYYINTENGYLRRNLKKPLHYLQVSADNLRRKITGYTVDGLFIWYSGNSKLNDKGALMVYYVKNGVCYNGYAMLSESRNWNILTALGELKGMLEEIMTPAFAD